MRVYRKINKYRQELELSGMNLKTSRSFIKSSIKSCNSWEFQLFNLIVKLDIVNSKINW